MSLKWCKRMHFSDDSMRIKIPKNECQTGRRDRRFMTNVKTDQLASPEPWTLCLSTDLTLEVAGVPASVEAAEGVSRAVHVSLAHAPAVGLHSAAIVQVGEAVYNRTAAGGDVVASIVVPEGIKKLEAGFLVRVHPEPCPDPCPVVLIKVKKSLPRP
jgi:hypothetical protein